MGPRFYASTNGLAVVTLCLAPMPLTPTTSSVCRCSLHLTVLRPAPALPRSPSRADHVRRFAVDTVCRTDDQPLAVALVDPRRAHVGVQLRHFRRNVRADDEMRRDVVTRRVPGFEYCIQLAQG